VYILNKGVYLENTSADLKPSKGTPVNATPSRGSWSIRTGAATTLGISISLLSVLRLGRGLLVSRLEVPPKILLVSHYFRVARPSKLITQCAVSFNTASADTRLISPNCVGNFCAHQHIYHPSQSSTAKYQRRVFETSDNNTDTTVDLYTDNVRLGKFEVSSYWLCA
jgi:hypothetical protein